MREAPKSFRVMYDGMSSGIWAIAAGEQVALTRLWMVSHEDLGLPYELAARFDRWILKGMDDPDHPNDPQSKEFISEERQLAIDLKCFLGSEYMVYYASQGNIRIDEEILLEYDEED